MRSFFLLSRSLIFYDVTNSHFEDFWASGPKAKHEKKQATPQRLSQIAVAITFDEYGFPLASESFEGDMADTKTLPLLLDHFDRHEDGVSSLRSASTGDSPRKPTSRT